MRGLQLQCPASKLDAVRSNRSTSRVRQASLSSAAAHAHLLCWLLQARTHPHAKGSSSWAKQMSKIASMLAAGAHGGGPKSHAHLTDHTDISACESLLENYFLLARL